MTEPGAYSGVRRRSLLVCVVGLLAGGGCTGVGPTASEEDEFHETGSIEVAVDGTQVDLSDNRFQAEHNPDHDVRFHLHEDDDRWHMERERVAFATAIDLLPHFAYDRTNGTNVVTVDGTTYDQADPDTEIAFFVDGDEVEPTEYEVQDGDHLLLAVRTE